MTYLLLLLISLSAHAAWYPPVGLSGGNLANMKGRLSIDGSADTQQLLIQGNGTQTANLVEIQNSSSTYLAGFDQNGHLRIRDTSATSATNPQLYFITGANKSGIGYNSAGVNSELFFTTNGTSRMGVSVAGFAATVPIMGNGNGASAPAIRPSASDGDTGLAWNGANDFCASSGGTCRMSFASSLNTSSVPLQISAQNELRLADSDSSNYVALKSAATVGTNFTWTLPAAVCSSGQSVRFNDGSGTMECYTPAGGGSGFGSWSAETTISIAGSSSNPTKGTIVKDATKCRDIGTDWVECEFRYSHTSGAADGSGSYLFGLQSGCTFDTAETPALTTADSSLVVSMLSTIESDGQVLDSGLNLSKIKAVVYSSTQFRVGFPGTATTYMGSTYMNFGKNPLAFFFKIRFKGDCP